jgi:LPXTG-motif cell wall-anchored protein
MYFKLSDSKELKWDGNDEHWYVPVVENFSFGSGESGGNSSIWIYLFIMLVIAAVCGYLYYKRQKDI